ncbi:hypothetical protein HOLleu_13947 [Holothuria leucospilota]|uniref:Uncharacterized protein n=1 Tax=Holothuria leucospilota TaxID=206669 RepID=A0A9Q1HBC3_HOLLE|nr:hypothetical protein HOLleu_13947 [Holothuria leucospilota]
MTGAFGAAVIVTACTKTVCGQAWLDNYKSKLHSVSSDVKSSSTSKQEFHFGDGVTVASKEKVVLPAMIGNTYCDIATEVVSCDIPLLLSKDSLKRANAVLDLANDTATILGQSIPLECTPSGHHCVNLQGTEPKEDLEEQFKEVLVASVEKESGKGKHEGDEKSHQSWDVRKLTKLHKQFGHANVERMTPILKGAGVSTDVRNQL